MSEPMPSCAQVVSEVSDYLEGALTMQDSMRFERHVAICPPCRGYLAQMREMLRAAGRITEDELPPETRQPILDAFRDWRDAR